ncbi:hypothetical protein [Parendozoicomonas haliclonae]
MHCSTRFISSLGLVLIIQMAFMPLARSMENDGTKDATTFSKSGAGAPAQGDQQHGSSGTGGASAINVSEPRSLLGKFKDSKGVQKLTKAVGTLKRDKKSKEPQPEQQEPAGEGVEKTKKKEPPPKPKPYRESHSSMQSQKGNRLSQHQLAGIMVGYVKGQDGGDGQLNLSGSIENTSNGGSHHSDEEPMDDSPTPSQMPVNSGVPDYPPPRLPDSNDKRSSTVSADGELNDEEMVTDSLEEATPQAPPSSPVLTKSEQPVPAKRKPPRPKPPAVKPNLKKPSSEVTPTSATSTEDDVDESGLMLQKLTLKHESVRPDSALFPGLSENDQYTLQARMVMPRVFDTTSDTPGLDPLAILDMNLEKALAIWEIGAWIYRKTASEPAHQKALNAYMLTQLAFQIHDILSSPYDSYQNQIITSMTTIRGQWQPLLRARHKWTKSVESLPSSLASMMNKRLPKNMRTAPVDSLLKEYTFSEYGELALLRTVLGVDSSIDPNHKNDPVEHKKVPETIIKLLYDVQPASGQTLNSQQMRLFRLGFQNFAVPIKADNPGADNLEVLESLSALLLAFSGQPMVSPDYPENMDNWPWSALLFSERSEQMFSSFSKVEELRKEDVTELPEIFDQAGADTTLTNQMVKNGNMAANAHKRVLDQMRAQAMY